MSLLKDGSIEFADMSLTLLWGCNYRCPHCLVGDSLASKEALSYDEAVDIIDSAANLRTIRSIGYVGGEPFLVYPLMLRLSQYIHAKYPSIRLTASTNSYWASSLDNARKKIEPLVQYGLESLLLSWDDFHAKFGKICQVANAITVCQEFGLTATVQNIYVNGASRISDIREQLNQLCDTSGVEWGESPCTPVGLGAKLDRTQHRLVPIDDLPFGDCTAGDILNVEADGSVKPCCGAGVMSSGLTMGNTRKRAIRDIVQSASYDPLFNSLVAYKGPKHLVQVLRSAGRADLVPTSATEVCDACFQITNNPEAVAVIRKTLQPDKMELLLSRAASEIYSTIPVIPRTEDTSESLFRNVPNIQSALPIPALTIGDGANATFQDHYVCTRRPVILRGRFSDHCAVFDRWRSDNYLKERAGEAVVQVTIGMTKNANLNNVVEMSFSEYLDHLATKANARSGRGIYMEEHDIPEALIGDITSLDSFLCGLVEMDPGQWSENASLSNESVDAKVVSFVGKHTYTGSHEHGGWDAFLVQIRGTKEVLLHEPTEANLRSLYAARSCNGNWWSPIELYDPDLEQHTELRNNVPLHTRVEPGEILYIPDGWFHAVSTLGDELSITLTFFLATDKLVATLQSQALNTNHERHAAMLHKRHRECICAET